MLNVGRQTSAVRTRERKITVTRGQTLLTITVFFTAITFIVLSTLTAPVVRRLAVGRTFYASRESFFAAHAGAEDASYRLSRGLAVPSSYTLSIGAGSATVSVGTNGTLREIVSAGSKDALVRRVKVTLKEGSGSSFRYGVQVGDGGLLLKNTSSVRGNVYSNGPVEGEADNLIKGDVVSAGPNGLIKDVHATSSAYAHSIDGSMIDKDAYYVTISNTTVLGTLHPGSPDQATSTLPISDAKIDEWKNDAVAGGTISSPCPYTITAATTIGPKKISCDLRISGEDYTVTLEGALWVVGDITVQNRPTIRVSEALAGKGVVVIADNESDRTASSKIILGNEASFAGAGAGSHVLFVSQNRSAEDGGSEIAINVKNNAHGDLIVYAGHGEILIENTVNLTEVTGYKVQLKNAAEVIYKTGVANAVFTSGPSGGYVFDTWREVE